MVCKVCGETDPRSFYTFDGQVIDEHLCIECSIDGWEAEQPNREQARREQLDSQGYYDDPEKWEMEYGRLARNPSS